MAFLPKLFKTMTYSSSPVFASRVKPLISTNTISSLSPPFLRAFTIGFDDWELKHVNEVKRANFSTVGYDEEDEKEKKLKQTFTGKHDAGVSLRVHIPSIGLKRIGYGISEGAVKVEGRDGNDNTIVNVCLSSYPKGVLKFKEIELYESSMVITLWVPV